MLACIARELGRLYHQPRVGEEPGRFKGKAEFGAAPALALLALPDTRAKQAFEQHALGRGLGVDLVADPGVFQREFLLQRIDNARADVAVGSDVIGEDAHRDGHVSHPLADSPLRRSSLKVALTPSQGAGAKSLPRAERRYPEASPPPHGPGRLR